MIFHYYSNAAHLILQAEGDTTLYEWEPLSVCGGMAGVFVRHNAAGGGMGVVDRAASRDSAWQFDPGRKGDPDSIWVDFSGLGKDLGKTYYLRFQIRAQTAGCNDELARITLRKNISDNGCAPVFITRAERPLNCADFPDTNYHVFDLGYTPGSTDNEWGLRLVLEWTGRAKLWVDYIGVLDDAGGKLVTQSVVSNNEILNYVNRYTFGRDPGVMGFYMMEEAFQDANVYPQFRVDSLFTEIPGGGLTPFTEHNECTWWEDRHSFGGRNTASARKEKLTPVSACFYPYSGYHFESRKRKTNPLVAGIDTVRRVLAQNSCPVGDSTICLQEQIDALANQLSLYKRMSDSTHKRFMPFLQAYSSTTRPTPDNCNVDTSSFVWQVATREPTENETKLESSMALAYGANGLLFYVGGSTMTDFTTIPCGSGTIPWQIENNHRGFTDLPGVKDACHSYVGPLIDALGYLFGDTNFKWQGAGRLDPAPGVIPGCFIQSVASLTLPQDESAYVEGGFFKFGTSDFFMLVNRRAGDSDPQTLRVTLPVDSAAYVIDQYSYDSIYVTACTGHGSFVVILPPGEGKLFKVARAPLALSAVNLALRKNTDGAAYGDGYGWAVSSVGDVDADGTPDYAVGAPWASSAGLLGAGSVYVYSGKTGQLLHLITGIHPAGYLGWAICALGDVNHDGHDDFVVGEPGQDRVRIYSGSSGTTLYSCYGSDAADRFGWSLASIGDWNHDGIPDFIVGAPGHTGAGGQASAGCIYVFSGTGTTIHSAIGARNPAANDQYGYSVAAADVNGDGTKEFVVGAPCADDSLCGVDAGAVYVGNWRSAGFHSGDRFGWSVGCVGDINLDGSEEIIIGAPYVRSDGGADSAGAAYVFFVMGTAMTEDPLTSYLYKKSGTDVGDKMGWSVAGVGDVNGDCIPDFAAGAPGMTLLDRLHAGAAFIYTGDSGIQITRADGVASGDGMGSSLAAVVRPFGQSAAYVLSGMPTAERGGNTNAGAATVLGMPSSCNCPRQGDINDDSFIDVFDVIGAVNIAFSGAPDITDPKCPTSRADVNNDLTVDVFDVVYLVNAAFTGGPPPVNPCGS